MQLSESVRIPFEVILNFGRFAWICDGQVVGIITRKDLAKLQHPHHSSPRGGGVGGGGGSPGASRH